MPGPAPNLASYWEKAGLTGLVSRAILRTLQCIFAIIVAVLYGLDLKNATGKDTKTDSSWIYAEFVAGASMVVCIVHLFFTTTKCSWTILDGVMFILWLALFGVFASLYLEEENPEDKVDFVSSQSRMKAAVWVDLMGMLFWLATTIQGTLRCCARRKKAKMLIQEEDGVEMNGMADRN
ncbi:hypothetical protein NM208_g9978 [Fusarium decemcellulare]|uniref:Uncharacterized protein n=1 Tax=Fusarium decemcellulare TaxID=57161 RepID=A0ACC1RZJ6_9HYPO|nr:hypothetical protein NM208_g9978 [Fusarium decemcellulare]